MGSLQVGTTRGSSTGISVAGIILPLLVTAASNFGEAVSVNAAFSPSFSPRWQQARCSVAREERWSFNS